MRASIKFLWVRVSKRRFLHASKIFAIYALQETYETIAYMYWDSALQLLSSSVVEVAWSRRSPQRLKTVIWSNAISFCLFAAAAAAADDDVIT